MEDYIYLVNVGGKLYTTKNNRSVNVGESVVTSEGNIGEVLACGFFDKEDRNFILSLVEPFGEIIGRVGYFLG